LLSRERVKEAKVEEEEDDSSFTTSVDSTKSLFNTLLAKIEQLRKLENLISVRI
jgi:hypothetical protein